jgi:hypothetical protein
VANHHSSLIRTAGVRAGTDSSNNRHTAHEGGAAAQAVLHSQPKHIYMIIVMYP